MFYLSASFAFISLVTLLSLLPISLVTFALIRRDKSHDIPKRSTKLFLNLPQAPYFVTPQVLGL